VSVAFPVGATGTIAYRASGILSPSCSQGSPDGPFSYTVTGSDTAAGRASISGQYTWGSSTALQLAIFARSAADPSSAEIKSSIAVFGNPGSCSGP
jgi:hypothetical protein